MCFTLSLWLGCHRKYLNLKYLLIDKMYTNLVKNFCTPPINEITNFDIKALAKAKRTEIFFEGDRLPIYTWGTGKIVLLLHGWGSRASHFALMARFLSRAGFQVVAFDAPAHSSVNDRPLITTSSMFGFGRALSTVASQLGEIYSVVGHSLGAAAAAFTVSGFLKMAQYKIIAQRLVLISSPSNVDVMIDHFANSYQLSPKEKNKLKTELETEFDFTVSNYSVGTALKNNKIDLMLVHDKNDDVVPISNAYNIHNVCRDAELEISTGYGHHKILFNRNMFKKISSFLTMN